MYAPIIMYFVRDRMSFLLVERSEGKAKLKALPWLILLRHSAAVCEFVIHSRKKCFNRYQESNGGQRDELKRRQTRQVITV